ncbi:MAG TPA: HlyD family secretion protein [Candidatus Eremiobacteraceae bacterium]
MPTATQTTDHPNGASMTAIETSGNGNGTTGRKRRILIPLGVIAALALLFFGIQYLVFAAHHVTTDDAQINGDITTIAPRVKGQVIAVPVKENQVVTKGTRLLVLDDRDFQAAVAQAQAALQQARGGAQAAAIGVPLQNALTAAQTSQAQAGVSQAVGATDSALAKIGTAQAGVRVAKERVSVAQAQLAAADAALNKAKSDRDRAAQLVAAGAISHQQDDAAVAAYQSALANDQAARVGVDVAVTSVQQASNDLISAEAGAAQASAMVSASQAQLAQARTGGDQSKIKQAQSVTGSAQASAAQAALDIARLQLSYTVVTAPVDGVVSKKSVNIGDTVASGQPVMAVASQTGLWVVANLKETQLTSVRAGQPVAITVDAFPHQKFTGTVSSISPATGATFALIPPDNASGNFTKVVQRIPIRIDIDPASDPTHLLRQGLSAVVSIDTSSH